MLEFIVFGGMIQQMMWGGSSKIQLDIPLLIDAAFAAGAAMISFGAVLGRTTPTQIAWLLALQVHLGWLPRCASFVERFPV
jgi:ammonium transporter Rh